MNIKSYLFRLTIAAIAFVSGFSAQGGFQKLERFFLQYWLGSAAAAVKKVVPFQSQGKKLAGESNLENRNEAFYVLAGKYYLSEEHLPSGFSSYPYFELKTHFDLMTHLGNAWTLLPEAGTVHAERTYEFKTIAINREFLVFETEVVDGSSYRFSGRALQTNKQDMKDFPDHGVGDIFGKLERWENGTLIATIETTFYRFSTGLKTDQCRE